MATPNSPPCSSTRSPPIGCHPSPLTEQHAVTYPSQQASQQQPYNPLPPSSTPSISSSYYSATSSPKSTSVSTYPPIYQETSQHPSNTLSTPAAMAPSTAMARNPALAFELAPTSTPTGRISKAKKGKRVHACEFPGCGKIFTRAEHKRRHELNHNPDATYHCRQGGCNKSFHRLDLLQRHQERHELEASGGSPPRRYPSQTSVVPEHPQTLPVTSMTSPRMSETAPRTSSGTIPIDVLVHPQSRNNFAPVPYMPWTNPPDELYYASSDTSSLQDSYHPPSDSSASSVNGGYDVTGSPMVTASIPTHWLPGTAPPNTMPTSMCGGDDYMSSAAASPMPIPLSHLDGYEWSVIRRELSTAPGLLPRPGGAVVPDTVRWHCLELYWQYFHPTFPVVHRPTFLPAKPSPLLASAMVAIGSFYDNQPDSKNYSLALLSIAIKILRSRQNITSRSRIVDLQTVVLLEILSTFYARQISVQMSTRFRALFANLNQAHHWLTTSPLAVYRTLKPNHTPADLNKAHKFFVEHETRSRILHACTVLDSQQAQLFEQSHTIRRHSGLRLNVPATNQTFHLPCDDSLWDASPVENWAQLAQSHEYAKITQGRPTSPPNSTTHSFFQSQVISANVEQGVSKAQLGAKSRPPPTLDLFTNEVFNYHVSEMCKHTPIRSLLIVTGESWILGRKVEKQADYSSAKQDLRKWLDGATLAKKVNADSVVAHWHALQLLKGLMGLKTSDVGHGELFGTTCMMHENWSVYLATLVCWAHSRHKALIEDVNNDFHMNQASYNPVHTDGAPYSAPAVISHPVSSLQAAQEAESYLLFSDYKSPSALRDIGHNVLSRVLGLVETVRREKIVTHVMSGLMNDAEQVLLKLVAGNANLNF